jgi:endonuclease YncB( thermonuclease family)
VCRLYGVDAPEVRQPLWEAARGALADLMTHDPEVAVRGRDRYGRSLCVLTLADGDTINRDLVRRGLAEVYRGRAPDRDLVALEREARATGRGIWGLTCYESPAAYRQRKVARIAGPCKPR